jgi:uncharacterized repeat protein (TIGR03803 family)
MALLLFAANAWCSTETVLHDFSTSGDGFDPADYGRLARDKFGNLYGTTQGGGSCGMGTVFELSKAATGWNEKILYNFCGIDGENPVGGVVLDSSGNIYGTTKFGASCGTVFKLAGSLLATLYTFSCGNDGGKPDSGVVLDNNGNLFGTTGLYGAHGDANGGGVVYEISNSGTFSILYWFCSSANCSDGSSPDGGVVMASENVIWGTTAYGGNKTCNCGTVFKLTKSGSSWNETVVHRFIGGTHDGANPFTAPTIGVQTVGGKKQLVIFGVTETGGGANLGTVFEVLKSKHGYAFRLLHGFNGADGNAPLGQLTFSNGNLFGTTYQGGAFGSDTTLGGTVFELSPANRGWNETLLYSFTGGSDGSNPVSGVVRNQTGNLYGITGGGGFGVGVVYEVAP